MPSIYLYLIGGAFLFLAGFGSGFVTEDRLDRSEIVRLSTDLNTSLANEKAIKQGIDQCNSGVDKVSKAAGTVSDAAKKMIAAADKGQRQLQGNIDAVNAFKATAQECPDGESILKGGFQ